MVSLTDAPGDFISYIVNVVSLQLTRADGTVVQTVPVTTQVDFAQLVNLSEIVSAAQIPAGRYVAASITLDYSGATIVVDNGTTGVTILPADIIDGATSMPLAAPNPTQVTLTLSLDTDNQLVVTPNTIANLALDFNLAASNAITPSNTDPTTVTVNPVLTASLVPDTSKQIRVRGPLVSVSTTASSYIVGVRPFYNSSGMNGQVTVATTATTTYSINGTAYTGSAGLTQLATLSAGTVTAAYGTWDTTSQTFTASNVLAGSSVAGTSLDSVEGTVVARTGDTLTLLDDLLYHAGQFGIRFEQQVTVTVGTGTTVTEAGASGAFSIEDISVGQHVQIFGTLGADSAGNAGCNRRQRAIDTDQCGRNGSLDGGQSGDPKPAEPGRTAGIEFRLCRHRQYSGCDCDRLYGRATRGAVGDFAERRAAGALLGVRHPVRVGSARLHRSIAGELRAEQSAAAGALACTGPHGAVCHADRH
jgi:hypothetical protein